MLLALAEHELAYGDPGEAAERAHSAGMAALRAHCADHNWPGATRHDLSDALRLLDEESGDDKFHLMFAAVEQLQNRYFEYNREMPQVLCAIDDVRRFIDKLDALP
ncbi:MAG: hypothetical protein OXI41_14810 [Chloroflexota bacterium]|nr:hypothetical protein [Chloroflexota bacterium]MDE2895840.1 hypothetical protein [Chloroflexota bacterium]